MEPIITYFRSLFPNYPKDDNSEYQVPLEDQFICYQLDNGKRPSFRGGYQTLFKVVNEDTLLAADQLIREEQTVKPETVVILDMANAKNPGGFYEDPLVHAQEEELVRRSPSLLHHLKIAKKFKNPDDINQPREGYQQEFIPDAGCLYFSQVEYQYTRQSDNLCIQLDTICAAAVDATGLRPPPHQLERMETKIRAILFAAHHQNKKDLILGAFGCGMFLNDPKEIAEMFHRIIHNEFPHVFHHIVFAIKDSKGSIISPFQKTFTN